MFFARFVHAFTASGALVAYLALVDASTGQIRRAFLWLVLATLIDAVDGSLARLARVKERTPHFNGARLDDIVDYLTFVFVPAFLLHHAGVLPRDPIGLLVVGAVLLASAAGFSRDDAKTADHFFTGFPSYWNIVALYMIALGLAPAANGAILVGLAGLVFVPIGYVYPSRTPQLRRVTIALGIAWGAMIVGIILTLPAPPAWLVWSSLLYPAYYIALSLYLHSKRDGV
jgi:phosphatidylcholine synthase